MKIVLAGAMCPTLCGYVFDKGFVVLGELDDPTDLSARDKWQGLTICSRCKRWLGVRGGELHPLTHEQIMRLGVKTKAGLGGWADLTRFVENRFGKY